MPTNIDDASIRCRTISGISPASQAPPVTTGTPEHLKSLHSSEAYLDIFGAEAFSNSLFASNISRKLNVVQPTVLYRDGYDLRKTLDPEIVQPAEATRNQVAPPT